MYQENSEKKEFTVATRKAVQTETGGSTFCESSSEHVLPDYLPKVQKVLRVETNVLPPQRYVNTAEAQMSGNLLHTLIYRGEEGEVAATVLPARYSFSVPLPASGAPHVIASVEVDSSTHRMTAPRKVQIRTRLRARTCILDTRAVAEEQLPAGRIGGLHRLEGVAETLHSVPLCSSEVRLSERVDVGSTNAHLIWCGATAAVQDTRAMEGGVNVRGDACIKLLFTDSGKLKSVTKRVPFDAFLDGDVTRNASAAAAAHVLSTEAAMEQGSEATVDLTLSVEALADMTEHVAVTEDAFSEIADGKISWQTIPTIHLLADKSAVYTVGGSVAKAAAGAMAITEIIDTAGAAVTEEICADGGRYSLNGRCLLNLLYVDGEETVCAADFSFPFHITVDAKAAENANVTAAASLLAARTRVEGENLVCDMDIAVSLRALACGEQRAVATLDYTAAKPCAALQYPDGESLWSLAKAYRVSPPRLAAENGLAEGDLRAPLSAGALMLIK